MAQLTKGDFESKYTSNSGGGAPFKDNTNGEITAIAMRTFSDDIADSFMSISDNFIDEDSFASDSATKAPSQQSVKAYVDNQIDGITSGLTLGRIPIVGPSGFIDDSDMTFSGNKLTVTVLATTGIELTLGSDATGDIFFRHSLGFVTRLGIGSTGQYLGVSGGGIPAWQSTGLISGLTAGRIAVASSATALTGNANFTYDGADFFAAVSDDITLNAGDAAVIVATGILELTSEGGGIGITSNNGGDIDILSEADFSLEAEDGAFVFNQGLIFSVAQGVSILGGLALELGAGSGNNVRVNSLSTGLGLDSSTAAFYLGVSTTDGTWRIVRSGDDLLFQQRESGSYVTKGTISG